MSYSETVVGVGSWIACSIGMMVFNKLAITAMPLECVLVATQMAFCVIAMLFCWQSLHVGSMRDLLRWCLVVPAYSGMLLTSILALKYAPMTLVVTFRALSPLLSLAIERFYPEPLRISLGMVASMAAMVLGTAFYVSEMPTSNWSGVQWAVANIFFAVADRLLQRLMLAKDQYPVDMSKTAITLVNNLAGSLLLTVAACLHGEFGRVPGALAAMDMWGGIAVASSCIVGVGISYTGIWAQSLISATSFLVLVNANKFVIIFIEVLAMHNKKRPLGWWQIIGAVITVAAGAAYGKASEIQARKTHNNERQPLVKDTAYTAKAV
mmetsp:Transcript_111727/g.222099  ORF Transcript_111727/g.222099 Transcript_111727/m.222099 type:complete len:323 (-) Transcript_111727:36-1004(-)|eukprot:CAMPEP_0172669460 /NCGR_PEP_ID=MMETSP1074-20121228/9692_1 /TAXON_ID=2916 /ORGANISM="Ceratium fusus, Strain PA161109" /LENGTH=322 /DNA_ID=CAMNT_0013486237 /DNA_START=76 /DNA_END=1044 /DNA_ORIENTATION=-